VTAVSEVMLYSSTIGTHCTELHKMVYLSNRRYLPAESAFRQETIGFPSNKKELLPPPAKRKKKMVKNFHKAVDVASKRSSKLLCGLHEHACTCSSAKFFSDLQVNCMIMYFCRCKTSYKYIYCIYCVHDPFHGFP